jgi:hypothetical protein
LKKAVLLSLFLFFCARFLSAQSQGAVPQVSSTDPATAAFRQLEIFRRSVRQAHEERARQVAEKQAEQLARFQFREKGEQVCRALGGFCVTPE